MAVIDATASLLSMLSRWSTAIDIANNIGGAGDPPANSADPGSGAAPSGSPPANASGGSDPVVMSPGMLGADAVDSPDFFVSAASDELPPATSDDPTAPGAGASDVAQSLSGLRPPRADPANADAWPTDTAAPAGPSSAEPGGDGPPLALVSTALATADDGGDSAGPGVDEVLPDRTMGDPEVGFAVATAPSQADEADGAPQSPAMGATGADEDIPVSRPTQTPEIPVLAAAVVASTDALMRDVDARRDIRDLDHGRPAERAPDTTSGAGRTEAARVAARADSTADVPVQRGADTSGIDGWSLVGESPAASSGDAQVGQTGIIASFILNAAMIPGWPPPKPFEMPSASALLERLVQGAKGAPSEEDYFTFLSERGAKPSFLARLRKLLDKLARSRRLRMLLGLAALMSTIEVVLEALEDELTQLGGGGKRDEEPSPLEEAEVRRSLTA